MQYIGKFRSLFIPRCVIEYGLPVWAFWVGDENEAVLFNHQSGRLAAYVHRGENGCYYSTLYVSAWRALHIVRNNTGYTGSWRCFPRVAVDLRQFGAEDMSDAIEYVEYWIDHA